MWRIQLDFVAGDLIRKSVPSDQLEQNITNISDQEYENKMYSIQGRILKVKGCNRFIW